VDNFFSGLSPTLVYLAPTSEKRNNFDAKHFCVPVAWGIGQATGTNALQSKALGWVG